MNDAIQVNDWPQVVVIYRGMPPADVLEATAALVEAGVTAFEVTLNSPEPLEVISALAARFAGRALVGAGTVRGRGQVKAAQDAGATFIVSPDLDEDVVAATKSAGLVSIPGAYTPSEITRAWRAGADLVKVFPVQPAGVDYLRQIRQPLDDIPLFASGGVTAEIGRDCLAAGCVSLGVGAPFIDGDAVRDRDWGALADSGRRYLALAGIGAGP